MRLYNEVRAIASAIFILLFIFVLTACNLSGNVIIKSSEKIAEGVKVYCESTNAMTREIFRQQINARIVGGHRVKVECNERTNVGQGNDY